VKRVIVLGGGIGGVEAAIELRKKGFAVELISDRDYLFVYPLAIWIPTRETSFNKVSIPLVDLGRVHGFSVTIDRVTAINGAARTVTLEKRGERSDFDYAVIALGAGKMRHKGKEHVLSICGAPDESLKVQQRLDALLAKGSGSIAVGFGGNPKDSSGVRGGPGFEFLLNVRNLLKKRGMLDAYKLTFFAPMPKPGIRMGEKTVTIMDDMFTSMGIEQRVGKKITEFDERGVVFEDGSRVDADLTMFIAAGDGLPLIKDSDLPQNEAGFVKITPQCQVVGHPWLYAVGDVAAMEGPDWQAKQGHIAEMMARVAAGDIHRRETGRGRSESYLDHIAILCVMDMGNGAGLVFRNDKRAVFLPLPVVGHWLKKGWGRYFELSKRKKVPRIPGM
jgi:sulfide:quinone oxidoreductase